MKINTIDLFAGCGGLSKGFLDAGYNVVLGVDNDDAALKTFAYNHCGAKPLNADLSNPETFDVIENMANHENIDMIIAGPPCQGFSLTGPRNFDDSRNKLYLAVFESVKRFNPKAFVIENVTGMATLYKGQVKEEIIKRFSDLGYNVTCKVLCAADYGVPQIRKRLIFVGLRKEFGEFTFPEPLLLPENYITCSDAISDLPSLEDDLGSEVAEYVSKPLSEYQKKMRGNCNVLYNHVGTAHSQMVKDTIALVPEGGNYKDLPPGVGESRKFNEAWTRYDGKKPSRTIDTGHRNHFHYNWNRVPTIRENARLQSFPDDFVFWGTKTQQNRQVGNAVPPLLGYYLGLEIKKYIEENVDNKTKRKINTIDLFAGCGGLCEGFEMDGRFKALAYVEWEKAPCLNLVKHLEDRWKIEDAKDKVLRFDIQRTQELFDGWDDVTYGKHIGLDETIGANNVDLIIGGPPCQAYSIAGRVRDENGMKDDYRNFLFESYVKVVFRYQPKAFIFENVPGLLSAAPTGEPIINIIKETFDAAGYKVLSDLSKAIVDFSDYGVPQNRKRMVILGLQKDFYGNKADDLLKAFYEVYLPRHKVNTKNTVRKAISDLPELYPIEEFKIGKKKYSHSLGITEISNHEPRWHNKRDQNIFSLLANDVEKGENKYLSTDALKKLYTEATGRVSNVHKYHVLKWDEPSNLIPAHLYKDGLRHIHPDARQARSITVREAARLQGFPDDYEFIGSQADAFKMIGNAVPPIFSKVLADALYELLFKKVGE